MVLLENLYEYIGLSFYCHIQLSTQYYVLVVIGIEVTSIEVIFNLLYERKPVSEHIVNHHTKVKVVWYLISWLSCQTDPAF